MTEEGRCPYKNWLNGLEKQTQAVVHDYIDRVLHDGSRKNVKALGDGVWEIKIQHRHVIYEFILLRSTAYSFCWVAGRIDRMQI